MSSSTFIRYPIETNPSTLRTAVYNYIKARAPQWDENDPNLDVWMIQAITTLAAELAELASNVPTDIFRFFGATMISIPPLDATHSTVTATFTVQDSLGYTIPAGTQVGIRDAAGNLVPFETPGVDTFIPAGSTTANIVLTSTNPGLDTSGLGGAAVAATLLDTLSYVTSVVLQAATTGGQDAEEDDAYLNRLSLSLRLLSTRPILPADFAIMARNVAGVYRAVAIDGYNPFHNLLTANDASIETSAAGYVAGSNSTIARSVAQAADGAASLGITSVAAGAISAVLVQADQIAVTPGETITALASFRAATVGRNAQVGIAWYTSGNVFIATALGAVIADITTGFIQAFVTAVAPATAAFARINPIINATGAAGELHYVDKLSLRRGTTTDWVPGGTPDTGNTRTIFVAALDASGNDVSAPIQSQIDALLQANREINFIVNVGAAVRTSIDVTYQVKALTSYDPVDVHTRVDAAISAYLSAANWGNTSADPQAWNQQSTLYYLELASLINSVEGVDRITTTAGNYDLTIGLHGSALARSDIVLPGAAPLTTPGTITGAVV